MSSKKYDVLVWGATGFTGRWVAKHLFENYPQDSLSWAIAGRNKHKLAEVREFIGDTEKIIDGYIADSNDEGSLQKLVATTRVIISTVGPYAFYGSSLVKACAEAGTHYVDLTGEVPWMREMIDTHSAAAEQSGARIVHSCGFDSIPSDMGNFFIQSEAFNKFGAPLKSVSFVLRKMKGGASGGTIHSLLNVMKEAVKDESIRRLMLNPYSLNPDKDFRGADTFDQRSPIYDEQLGVWTAPFVMAGINTRVVRRGNAIADFPYGEEFSYTETMQAGAGFKGRIRAMSIAYGFGVFALIASTRLGTRLLEKILPAQGEGPTVDPDNPGFYEIDFHGETASGEKIVARVKGDSDPGYGSTSKMLAEAAICLALKDGTISIAGGFWTPSTAMGHHLLERLEKNAGLSFEVIK